MRPAIDATSARVVGRDIADEMGEGWLLNIDLSPGERRHIVEQIRTRLGIPLEHRRRLYSRLLIDQALATFNMRMEARRRSMFRRYEQRFGSPA